MKGVGYKMSDFQANVEVKVSDSELTAVEQRLQSLENKTIDVDLKINDSDLQSQLNQIAKGLNFNLFGNAGKQAAQAGQSTGKQFADAFNNSIKVDTGGSQIQNLQKTLKSMNFKTDAITAITSNLNEMQVAVKKVTADLSGDGKSLNVKVEGVDSLDRAVTIMKSFNTETGKANARDSLKITQEFEDLGKIAQKASTYAKQLEDLKTKFKSMYDLGDSSTNSFKKMIDEVDFSNIGSSAQLDEMVTKLKEAQAEGQRLNSLMSKKWESNGISQITKEIQDIPTKLTQLEEKFKSIGSLGTELNGESIQGTINSLRLSLDAIEQIQNPDDKINAYNQLSNTLKQLQNAFTELQSKAKNTFSDNDISKYQSSLNDLESKFTRLGSSGEKGLASIKELRTVIDQLGQSDGTDEQYQNFKKIGEQIDSLKISYRDLNNEAKTSKFTASLESWKSKTTSDLQTWMNNNTKAATAYATELEKIQQEIQEVNSETGMTTVKKEISALQSKAKAEGNTGNGILSNLWNSMTSLSPLFGMGSLINEAISGLKSMYNNVVEVDTAMTNLYKVTDETSQAYESFLTGASDTAQEVGRSLSDVIEQTSEWAKLGYSLDDSAELAKISSIYANVGEVDNDTAVSDMVTAMKAFNIQASEAETIVDSLNKLGNEFATSSGDLGEGLRVSASSLNTAGVDIDEALAMLTGMTEITQDANESGNALKVFVMRILRTAGSQ